MKTLHLFLSLIFFLPVFAHSADQPIILSELYPNPNTGEEEWIEIQNVSTDDIDIEGWQIRDATNRAYTFPKKNIKPSAYFVIHKQESKISLNNDGDTVLLFDSKGNVIDKITYKKSLKGESYARTSSWKWTTAPTPGAANKTAKAATPVIAPTKQKTIAKNQTRVTGIVTAPPGTIAPRTMYVTLTDETTAFKNIRVDFSGLLAIPKISLGDLIDAVGKLGSVSGEPRLLVENLEHFRVADEKTAPSPKQLSDPETEENGALVVAQGVVERRFTRGFSLTHQNGSPLMVTIPAALELSYAKGTHVVVTGILRKNTAGRRLLIRTADDLVIMPIESSSPSHSATKNTSPITYSPYIMFSGLTLAGLALGIRYWLTRPKQKLKNSDDLPFEIIDEEDL